MKLTEVNKKGTYMMQLHLRNRMVPFMFSYDQYSQNSHKNDIIYFDYFSAIINQSINQCVFTINPRNLVAFHHRT